MERQKLLAAYGLMGALALSEQRDMEYFLTFKNPYNGLLQSICANNDIHTYKKSQLTNRQKKLRAANKRAKQQRKRNR